jgi:hypothetical protein
MKPLDADEAVMKNMWEEVNRVARKKVSPRKPAAKKGKKAATRVTRKTTMKKMKKT